MKHDAWLRDAAREIYDSRHLEPDADFARAERLREPSYLEAVEAAFETRLAGRECEARLRQLPLL